MNLDKYLLKRFDRDRYNCWDFAREVWLDLTGADIKTTTVSVEAITPKLTEIVKPESPCLVLMLRSRCLPHVGVYYKGRVLHMDKRGAMYVDADHATACFPTVKYYK